MKNTKECFYYDDAELKTFSEIFNYGVKLAKENTENAHKFFDAYIDYLCEVNAERHKDRTYFELCAHQNFGYYAGYYDASIAKLVAKTFSVYHPFIPLF